MLIAGGGLAYGFIMIPADTVGHILYIASIATIITTLISFGLDQKLLVSFSREDTEGNLVISIVIRALILTFVCTAYFNVTSYNLFNDESLYLFIMILLYSSEIFNGAREYLINKKRYHIIFYSQIASGFFVLTIAAILHKIAYTEATFILLSFGSKFLFNILLVIYVCIADLERIRHNYVNSEKWVNYSNLTMGGLALLLSVLVLHVNTFISFQYIKTYLSDIQVANFGIAHRLYLYTQIPINIYIVVKTSLLIKCFDQTGANFKNCVWIHFKFLTVLIPVIILLGLLMKLIVDPYIAIKFSKYGDVIDTFLIFMIGIFPFIGLNIFSKYLISRAQNFVLFMRALVTLLINFLILNYTILFSSSAQIAGVIILSEIFGLLFMLFFMKRVRI